MVSWAQAAIQTAGANYRVFFYWVFTQHIQPPESVFIPQCFLALCLSMCYNHLRMAKSKKDSTAADKPTKDLQTFIENVNKKDKPNGKKIRFAFTKRKRKN